MRERIVTTAGVTPFRRFGVRYRPLLVIGTGPGWDKDLDRLRLDLFDVMVINKAMFNYTKRFDHYTTYHYENVERFISQRAEADLRNVYVDYMVHTTHSVDSKRDFSFLPGYDWRVIGAEGSSGLYGVCIGFRLGYLNIVCAGMPMTGDHDIAFWKRNWTAVHKQAGARLTSMSGWTRKLCGEPAGKFLS